MREAFGIDRNIQISLEIAVKDPNFKPSRQQISTLVKNGVDEARFIKNLNRHQRCLLAEKNHRMIKYYPIKYYTQNIVRSKPFTIKYIDETHPSYEILCSIAVKSDGLVLKYIKKQSHEIQLKAVTNNGLALKFCMSQTIKIQATAVKQNHNAIDYVDPKTEDFYFDILDMYPVYWTKIKDTPVARIRAIKKNAACIALMNGIDESFIKLCINEGHEDILRYVEQTPEISRFAVEVCEDNIVYIDDQTPELQVVAVEKNPMIIKYIRRPTLDVQRFAVNASPTLINALDQTDELCELVIKKDPALFYLISNPSTWLTNLAVKLDGMNLKYVDDQTHELCSIAIKQNPKSFQYVIDQTPALARLAISLYPDNVYYLIPSIVDDIVYENKYGNT